MFLTDLDLQQLTGFIQPRKQIAWLQREDIKFRVAADGHPRVLREHLFKLMGVTDIATRRRSVPDFSTLGA